MKNKLKINKGFTLVEMLIAISLFVVIAFISIGAILSIFDANRRAQSSKTVVDNLNLAIENMTRTIRFGGNYYCGESSNTSQTSDCSSGGSNSISITFEGVRVIYKWDSTAKTIKRSYNGVWDDEGITSPETKIEYLKFYIFGSSDSDDNQPYVIAVIEGYSGNKPTAQSRFSLQTLMSQRELDL